MTVTTKNPDTMSSADSVAGTVGRWVFPKDANGAQLTVIVNVMPFGWCTKSITCDAVPEVEDQHHPAVRRRRVLRVVARRWREAVRIRAAKAVVVKLRRNADLALTRDVSLETGRYEVNVRQDNGADDGNSMTPHEARRLARALMKLADHVEGSNKDAGLRVR